MNTPILDRKTEIDLLIHQANVAFEEHVKNKVAEAVTTGKDDRRLLMDLRNDYKKFLYHVVKGRQELKQTIEKSKVRAAVLEAKRRRNTK